MSETDIDGANAIDIFDKSVEALVAAFPTLTKDDLYGLTLEQLTAIREFTEQATAEEAPQGESKGE